MSRSARSLRGRATWLSRGRAAIPRRLLTIVTVDVLVWNADRPARQSKTRADATVQEITSENSRDYDAILPVDLSRAARPMLARGDVGYIALVDGRFAGWIWISRVTHRDPWSGLRIRLGPDEAYTYAMMVVPEHRAAGVAAALVSRALSDASQDPAIQRVYGWVDRDNRESQTLLRLLFGFSQVQELQRVQILGRVGFKLPRSDKPPFGPLSARGHHTQVIGQTQGRRSALQPPA